MAQQIKITQTSNADMNIGVPKNMTAVEWLCERLSSKLGMPNAITFYIDHELEILQAKEMEKVHLMMAFNDGKVNRVLNKRNSEQYYNETYRGHGRGQNVSDKLESENQE